MSGGRLLPSSYGGACLRGLLPSVLRRPNDHERDSLAQSGNVFIYGEELRSTGMTVT
jgi:hypothetical protein